MELIEKTNDTMALGLSSAGDICFKPEGPHLTWYLIYEFPGREKHLLGEYNTPLN